MPKISFLNLWKQASKQLSRTAPKSKARRTPESTPNLLVFPEHEGLPALPFMLIRDRFRTMRITVRRDGSVQIKIPFFAKDTVALRAIGQKRAWIEGKRHEFRQRPPLPAHDYRDGDVFYYLGQPFSLLLRQTSPCIGSKPVTLNARIQGKNLVVDGNDLNPERVQKAIALWRNTVGRTLFGKRLPRLHDWACGVIGDKVPLPEWKLRALKRRWASCARQHTRTTKQHFPALSAPYSETRHEITLARHLSAVPLECIDYVIVHELCHMRHMNHSPRFYALLSSLLPNAPQLSRYLDAWSLEHGRDENTPSKG